MWLIGGKEFNCLFILSVRRDIVVVYQEFGDIHKRLSQSLRRVADPLRVNGVQEYQELWVIGWEITKE